MSIIRVKKRENPYAIIDKTAQNDARLSWEAKGLIDHLLGKPDGWKVRVNDLIKRSSNGKDSVYSILKELIAMGYIIREAIRNDSGRIVEWEYQVFEVPSHFDPVDKSEYRPSRKKKKPDDQQPENPDVERNVTTSGHSGNGEPEEPDSPLPDIPDMVKPELESPVLDKPDYSNKRRLVINDSSKEEEEEDSEQTASAPPSGNEQTLKTYLQYAQILVESQKQGSRDITISETHFLALCESIPLAPDIAFEIYQRVGPELRSAERELIQNVMKKLASGLLWGEIKFDIPAWFAATWKNEKQALNQKKLINQKYAN